MGRPALKPALGEGVARDAARTASFRPAGRAVECRERHVVLSVPVRLDPWQEIVRGVYRYVESSPNWVLSLHPEEDVADALAAKPDGVIAMVRTPESALKLQAWGGPVVDAAGDLEWSSFVEVGFDALAAGSLAAEHLLLLARRSFAFAGRAEGRRSRMLRQGFVNRLTAAGVASTVDIPLAPAAADSAPGLRERLASLQRPAAVFAESDPVALRVAAACGEVGLRVPQDVAVLGCLNDEFLCTVSRPPLSSLAIPVASIGYEAGRALDAMMSGIAVPARIDLPPLGVVTRESTDPAALAEPALAAALRFIRENAGRRIGVEDIAEAGGMSRSSLERRFRAVVGRSPLAELLRERVDRARHLLVSSQMSLKEVAAAAGFHDVRHLTVTFRQKVGVTPGRFRARYRGGVGEEAR